MREWRKAIEAGDFAAARALLSEGVRGASATFEERLNWRVLCADSVQPPVADREAASPPPFHDASGSMRIAVVSLLFNWPSTGGGTVHTAELCRFLTQAGYVVCHFYAVHRPWKLGEVTEDLPYASHALVFDESAWRIDRVAAAFEETISAFAPDAVIITDSWNSKPLLANALSRFPCYLRLAAQECICPLNNVRLLPQNDGPPIQCDRSQLSDPAGCRQCVQRNEHSSGWLHQQEREFTGFGTSDYAASLQQAFRSAAGVLVVNPLIADACRSVSDNVHVIPSGFDPARFSNGPPIPPERPHVQLLFAGLIHEYMKGFHVLLEACARLWAQRQDFELHVTCDEDGWAEAPFLRYRGWKSQAELPELMAESDIVVVPTVAQEALGRTAVEAMGAARPVIASRIGGLPFTVEDNVTGLLVEPGDPNDLASAIDRLLDDRPLRHQLGSNGRQKFMSEFTWDVIIEQKYRPLFAAVRATR